MVNVIDENGDLYLTIPHTELVERFAAAGYKLEKVAAPPIPEPPVPEPELPVKSEIAEKLLNYLINLDGILSGQESMYWSTDFTDGQLRSNYDKEIYRITGKYPALYSTDFGDFSTTTLKDRSKVVDVVKANAARGSIIQLHYHMIQPNEFDGSGFNTMHQFTLENPYPAEMIDQILTPGSDLYLVHMQRLDEIAGYLAELKAEGIPVLWRPYHEMNGSWFWWGNQPRFKELWIQTWDRFTNTHGLDNLLWVFSSNYWEAGWSQKDPEEFYPGHNYVDILGVDIYTDYQHSYSQHVYNRLLEIGEGKPIAITENGEMPDVSQIKTTQPKWRYWSTWWGFHTANNNNTDALYLSNYGDDYVVKLKDNAPPEPPVPPETSNMTIHTIGDSITENPEWRQTLFNGLTDAGITADFVGSTTDRYPRTSEPEHDGHGGYSTHDATRELEGWFSQIIKPDLTIIMLGTNDIAWWIVEPISNIVNRIGIIIDRVKANSPNGRIIVASIPPQDMEPTVNPNARNRADMIMQYISGLENLVNSRIEVGISFVDIFSVLSNSDLRDGIHPNSTGNTKIGEAFLSEILSFRS